MTRSKLFLNAFFGLVVLGCAGGFAAYMLSGGQTQQSPETAHGENAGSKDSHGGHHDGSTPVRVTPTARKNLGLVAKPLSPTSYWRSIEVPGVVSDRPGISDRGVAAPVTGVVTQIHAYPGDSVAPNEPLFSLRLVSESLHNSQLELFKATKEIELARDQKRRLEGLAQSGAVAGSRMIEIDNQIARMDVNVQAYRQDLQARGLPADRIEAAARGEFVTEIVVRAPDERLPIPAEARPAIDPSAARPALPFRFELQSLKVELGQQVEGGEVLCYLADHRLLQIEGKAFNKDLSLIQRAAKEGLPVAIRFDGNTDSTWPPFDDTLHIDHVASTIDTHTRTFTFYLPLENQWQAYTRNGEDHLMWRFRPGDIARLSVAVEKLDNVFVLPQAAVVRDGAEAYVFRQNGDLFDRLPVHVLYEDRDSIVIAADDRLKRTFYIAQNSAAALNRILKSQSSSGMPAGLHVHADGTVHRAH